MSVWFFLKCSSDPKPPSKTTEKSYLSGSVQSFPHDQQASDPGQGQIPGQLPSHAADVFNAGADLEHVVAVNY